MLLSICGKTEAEEVEMFSWILMFLSFHRWKTKLELRDALESLEDLDKSQVMRVDQSTKIQGC